MHVCVCAELWAHQESERGKEGGRDEHVDRRRERERRRERGRRRKLKQQQRILWGCSRLEMKLFFPLVPSSESRGATQQLRRGHMQPAITGAPGFLSPLQASWSIYTAIHMLSQIRDRWTLQTRTCKSHVLICTQVVQRRAPYQSDQFRHAWLIGATLFQHWSNQSSLRIAVQLVVGDVFLWISFFSSSSHGSTILPSPVLAAF